jgi:uncharacterized protein (DUF488 family)
MKVYTIGYAGRKFELFLEILKANGVEVLVDVRSFPTSKYPEYRKEFLEKELPRHGVEYLHLVELGGLRGSYERHMQSEEFRNGVERLLGLARERICCMMCREIDFRYCHRRFISKYLEMRGVKVQHLR